MIESGYMKLNLKPNLLNFSISCILAIAIFLVTFLIVDYDLIAYRLMQIYGFIAFIYLYLSLLYSPLYNFFPKLKGKILYHRLRPSIGITVFLFASLHFAIAIIQNMVFIHQDHLFYIFIATLAWMTLFVLAITSHKFFIKKMGPWWKYLHRFIYLAAILILIHILMIGSHLGNREGLIYHIFSIAVVFLLLLEVLRLHNFLSTRISYVPKLNKPITFIYSVVGIGLLANIISGNLVFQNNLTNNNHLRHSNSESGNSKKFKVNFTHLQNITTGEATSLKFEILNSSNEPVTEFKEFYEKTSHLIIVNESLTYYQHIHPKLEKNIFEIDFNFPKKENYYLFLDYQPLGSIEEQSTFNLNLKEKDSVLPINKVSDLSRNKIFEDKYKVSLVSPNQLNSNDLNKGKSTLNFSITDLNGQPMKNLKPYLGGYGHLVMINTENFDYFHMHPLATATDSDGGPNIEFMPMPLNIEFKPGKYRIFVQLNPEYDLFVADFLVEIS